MPSEIQRIHALDNLRATVMFSGILLHAAISFMIGSEFWLVQDFNQSIAFNIIVLILDYFRSHLFFFLAGFFGHLLLIRSGLVGFLKQRALRIGLPFVIGMLTLAPLSNVIWHCSKQGVTPSLSLIQNEWRHLFFTPGHLWFLEMLLIICAGAALVTWLGRKLTLSEYVSHFDSAFEWLTLQPWRLLVLIPPSVLCIWPNPVIGQAHNKGHDLFPPIRAVCYYGLFFFLGWFLYLCQERLKTLSANFKSYLAFSVVSCTVLGLCLLRQPIPGDTHYLLLKTITLVCTSIYAWATSFAVTGWFVRYAGSHNPRIRYLADASYWFYLAHFPLVLWLQVILAEWRLNCWLKYTFIVLVNLVVLLYSYEWCVRYTWIGRMLNGVRTRTDQSRG